MWEGMRWPWDFCRTDPLQAEDKGDLEFKHGEPQTLVDNLEAHARRILEAGKHMLTFGGDHFISLPTVTYPCSLAPARAANTGASNVSARNQ